MCRAEFDVIPEAISQRPQWLVWRYEPTKTGKPRKRPFNPETGIAASVTNPAHWASFSIASIALAGGNYSGLGFVFAKGGNVWGLDVDDCITNGQIDGDVSDFLTSLNLPLYVEVSPSGTGLHAIGAGQLAGVAGRKRKDVQGRGWELYSAGRYFTVTGNCIPELTNPINAELTKDQRSTLAKFYHAMSRLNGDSKLPVLVEVEPVALNQRVVTQAQSEYQKTTVANHNQWSEVQAKLMGPKVIAQFNRPPSTDQSESDFALVKEVLRHLAREPDSKEQTLLALLLKGYRREHGADERKISKHTTYVDRTIQAAIQALDAAVVDEKSGAWRSSGGEVSTAHKPAYSWSLVSADNLKCQPVDWLIEGVLPSEAIGFLVGDSRSLKTFVALDMACCITTGTTWHGHSVKQGTVVYICGEGRGGLGRRLAAWKQYHQSSDPNLLNLLVADPMDMADLNFCRYVREQLVALPVKPVAVIIDTLARNSSANENDTREMNQLINIVSDEIQKPLGCHVLIAHHNNKTGGYRGSSTMMGNVDLFMTAKRDGTAIDDVGSTLGMTTVISCAKMKDAEEFEPITLQANEIDLGDGITSLVMTTGLSTDDDTGGDSKEFSTAKLIHLLNIKRYSQRELSVLAGLSQSSVSRLLTDAVRNKLVRHSGKGPSSFYHVTEKGRDYASTFSILLDEWSEKFSIN